ncbi:MAG: prolyl oligopeptidase family serine peptidase [Acidobacteriia bacterium]|nr:prolyl oligopeptidase family serine peptidase [Terriglobia bacterium]
MSVIFAGCLKSPTSFPPTERKPVTEEYFGIKVVDNYRWLDNLDDPSVRAWNDAQNLYSRAYLDQIPFQDQIYRRLKGIHEEESTRYYGLVYKKKLFAMKSQPSKNQPFLVVLQSAEDAGSERVVVDPNELNPKGTTAIDWFVPSHDGRLVAVSLSENGSEDGSVSVFEVESGRRLADIVPRVQFPTGGGDVDWNRESTGFYYTRYPQGNERPAEDINFFQQIYFHRLGTPSFEDVYVIGREFPKIAECKISSTEDGKYVLITVANGDGGEFAHYLKAPSGKWAQITQFPDKVVSAQFGPDNALYLLTRKDTPNGRILAVQPSSPKLDKAKLVVSESDVSISGFVPARTRLFVTDVVGGPHRIRVFDLTGKEQQPIPLKPVSAVSGVLRLEGDQILYGAQSYVDPPGWYRYDPATLESTKTALSSSSSVDLSNIEVSRDFATSRDGTKVPVNILMQKGTPRNGQNPTILYGYGGFGISESPSFDPVKRVWLEQGGIYAIANLRGGGEFGEAWHEAGKLTKKQNVFDDFAACVRFLIDKKYTNPARLAIEGGSNGGLLMGAVLTQHPELFRAAVSYVGIYDMLRFENFPNGVFNVTEYGTVKDREQFKALYAYSPYHHVEDGMAYPAVIFLTGDHDGRVDPANSRKMTARLQAATSSGLPVLLRTNPKAGHGIGTGLSDRISQEADVYAFLFDQLGVAYKLAGK